jgi:purine-cytosine permease-like protein
MLSGKTEFADVMSFGAVVLGSSITWGPFSSDYATYMREDTSRWKLFIYTWLGILISRQSNCRCRDRANLRDVARRRFDDYNFK